MGRLITVDVCDYDKDTVIRYTKDRTPLPSNLKWVKYIGRWFVVPKATIWMACDKPAWNGGEIVVYAYFTMPEFRPSSNRWYAEGIMNYELASPANLHHHTLKPENSLRLVDSNGIARKPNALS